MVLKYLNSYYLLMADGCTIGALNLESSRFLFKNRDLVYEDFKDSIIFDKQAFFVTGVDIATGKPSGASIGVNRHGLLICSSTVLVTENPPYDPLLELILKNAKTISDAANLAKNQIDSGSKYQWCNLVVSGFDGVGVIEIGPDMMEYKLDNRLVVRTNHHVELPTMDIIRNATVEQREAGGPLPTSQHRRKVAFKLLHDASSLSDIESLLSTHSDTKGFDSICRHSTSSGGEYLGMTSYSYIIESIEVDSTPKYIIHVANGNPCSNPFKSFDIEFDSSEDDKENLISMFP